ncbi:SDR family oxidoreductase [Blastococcus sp. URHD0036]|uniref:SDR family oxidoreductase n=1 Tax=Blastococcus sp. URHD0036 TaxID=1380356 RepID=UPI000497CFC7|nr:SDR family oxidoreductase [Blastococcus sp. URHD0036]
MSGALEGRVAIVTGAGRGIGRQHALLFAAEGAKVVVNDLGTSPHGEGSDPAVAQRVVEEIRAAGGEAVVNTDDVADAEGAARLVETALSEFGDLHVLVNNAGILRDRMLVNMVDADWDAVLRTHLTGHFLPTRAAAQHWRAKSKAGEPTEASVVCTTSVSGLFGMVGQTNYGPAKSGIATFAMIAADELARYGVRVNAIAPAAATRLIQPPVDGKLPMEAPPLPDDGSFVAYDPGHVSPFVGYLATKDCPITGRVFYVQGGGVHLFQPWAVVDAITKPDERWTIAELEKEAAHFATVEFELNRPYWG